MLLQNEVKGKRMNTAQRIKADWSEFEIYPTWSVVSSRELSKILNVSLQTICNWRLREVLPEPEPHNRVLKGNRNYYRISTIRAWLENTTEEAIHWAWVQKWFPEQIKDFQSLGQVEYLVKHCADILNLKKSRVPLPEDHFFENPKQYV